VTVSLDDAKAAIEGTLNVRRPDGPRQSFMVVVHRVDLDSANDMLRFSIELTEPHAADTFAICVDVPREVIFVDRPSGWGALIRTELRQWIGTGQLGTGAQILRIQRQRRHR
jgi:hypothetical protein